MKAAISFLIKTLTCPKCIGYVSAFLYLLFSVSACNNSKGDALKGQIDTLDFESCTTGVNTLISDSGVTKYKLVADAWYTYTTPEKKWYFPQGLYVEQFDTLMTTEASIKADTAYYYESKQLWYLVGNVHVMSREGEVFDSNSLYWDQKAEEVYSHEYIRIEKPGGQMLEGKYGFKSNQSMTRYTIFSSSGHLDVEDKPLPADSIPKDSLPAILPPPPPSAAVASGINE